jgi:AsmA-like C-terminal region
MPQAIVSGSARKTRKLLLPLAAGAALVGLGLVVLLVIRWPFRQEAVLKALEEASLTRVNSRAFHGTYFPHPGCVLENVTFQHNPKAGTPPLITVERLEIEGGFTGLFTSHLSRIRAEGMRLLIPAPGSGDHFQTPERSTFVVDEIVADGTVLEVASGEPNDKPLTFFFHGFTLSDVGSKGPATFHAKLSNPEPPGEITTEGKFGPWSTEDVGKTQVSGQYVFQHADLGVFPGIGGLLSSSGKFTGVLNHIDVEGDTEVPRFFTTVSTHQVDLKTKFRAVVDGENGDTFLQQVNATFWKTTVSSQGSVAKGTGHAGKTVSLQIATTAGRIQDILLLFAQSPRAPMSGLVSFTAKVSIPPERRPFLAKVKMEGDFGIDAGGFTKAETQQGVNKLSEGARGEDHREPEKGEADPETVLSDLRGHVLLMNGTARFSNLSFSVPGALAQLQGTYNLINEKIDLRGTLKTKSDVSKTTQGVKALILKVLDPFFKKKSIGYVVPVKITGTYEHPFFGLDLADKRNKKSTDGTAASGSSDPRP